MRNRRSRPAPHRPDPPSLSDLLAELRRATQHLHEAIDTAVPAGLARRGLGPRRSGRRRAPRRARRAGADRRSGRRGRLAGELDAPAGPAEPARGPPRRRRRGRPRRPRDRQRRDGAGEGRGLGGRPRPAAGRAARSRRSPREPLAPAAIEASPRCRSRCRRSTGSRCAAATPPASTSSSATTASTSTTAENDAALRERAADPLFRSGAVRALDGALSFVYKAAAEIGELGDNVAALRSAITKDELLHRALDNDDAHGRRARPHALGERRHHLRGERAPAEPGGGGRGRSAPVRTPPPRSTATSTTTPSSSRCTT